MGIAWSSVRLRIRSSESVMKDDGECDGDTVIRAMSSGGIGGGRVGGDGGGDFTSTTVGQGADGGGGFGGTITYRGPVSRFISEELAAPDDQDTCF